VKGLQRCSNPVCVFILALALCLFAILRRKSKSKSRRKKTPITLLWKESTLDTKPEKYISRRNFLKASAATVAAAAGTTALAAPTDSAGPPGAAGPPGRGGFAAGEPAAQSTAGSSPSGRVFGYSGEGDWLGTAPVIPDADIARTIAVDVLVLGGGHAGLLAALGASDSGVKVAVVESKTEKAFEGYYGRVGEDIGHVNSKWLIDRGYGPYDTGEIVMEFVKRAAGRCNPEIIRLFVENSGPMFDRMVEVYEEYEEMRKANDSKVEYQYSEDARGPNGGGWTETYDFSNVLSKDLCINQVQKGVKPEDYPIEIGGFKTWPCNAQFQGPLLRKPVGGFISVLRWFEKYHVKKTVDQGADWYYGTSAVVLTQEENGDVTGAIARDADGKYIKFRAGKGVIIATGGFQNNPDMCWALLNEGQEWAERSGMTKAQLRGNAMSGQGHKMACWAGGVIEASPRGGMLLGGGASGPWGEGPMLQLNAHAKRFFNEAAAPLVGAVARRQPNGILCIVTDRKYMRSVEIAGLEHGGPNYGRPEYYEDTEADMEKVLGTGAEGCQVRGCVIAERSPRTVYGANTIEELAGYLGYTGDLVKTFAASIKRYNELCYSGVDSDFGKDQKAMIPIDEPPFYGCKAENRGSMMLGLGGMATLSGLITDDKLRVLDREGNPIKGLFVCGNTLGGRYGLGYSTPFAGNSIGMAMTHGWLAGRFAAGGI